MSMAEAGSAPSSRAIGTRRATSNRADTPQMTNWKNETAPAPATLPSISWKGRSDETSTSMMRVVFSSSTELMTFTPYNRMAMNRRIAMTYARANDWPAFSVVISPRAIFFWASVTLRAWAQSTTVGFTPLPSSRTFSTTRFRVRCNSSMVWSDRFDARYSALPSLGKESSRMRNPLSCLASTDRFNESRTPGARLTAFARIVLLAPSASTTLLP